MKGLIKIDNIKKLQEFVDIDVSDLLFQSDISNCFLLDESIVNFVKERSRKSHKGTYGHALLITGSYGKIGAAVLSARACLRSGVGLLTVNIPKCGYEILQTSVPEAMCLIDENEKHLVRLPNIKSYKAIGIGPGIGKDNSTAYLLKQLLINTKQPLVLDADALNIISTNQEFLELIPERTILTPHIKEFDRLVGVSENTTERFQKLKEFSRKYNCIVVLKDAYTCISSVKGDFYFNTSGNQGMATGGSGDVLTGIITGLLAQGYEPLLAALIGVYFHGKAGDKAAKEKGYNALIASDIVENLRVEKNN